MLIESASRHIHQMQKALTQMNIQLHHVIKDITGETGMKIIREIVAGEKDPTVLAKNRHPRCKSSIEDIKAALTGNYRAEHLFCLKQSLELYDIFQEKIQACDHSTDPRAIDITENALNPNKKQTNKNSPNFNLGKELHRLAGVDLLAIPGVNTVTALQILSEIGFDMTRWRNAKQFASWLGLCPGNKSLVARFLVAKQNHQILVTLEPSHL